MPTSSSSELRFFGVGQRSSSSGLVEIWRYRELLFSLCLRDIQVQYRQSILGIGWALIRPLMLMVVFSWLFRMVGRVPCGDESLYAISLFAALLPWQLFSVTVTSAASCLVANEHLITKVYFPRLLLVLVPLGVALVDFLVSLVVLIIMIAVNDVTFSPRLLLIPVWVAIAMLSAVSISVWLSAANALYRDIRHAVPFFVQIAMFLSPVTYETRAVIPEQYQFVYSLNPVVSVVDGFRWSVLGAQPPLLLATGLSVGLTVAFMALGIAFFRHVERSVADRV